MPICTFDHNYYGPIHESWSDYEKRTSKKERSIHFAINKTNEEIKPWERYKLKLLEDLRFNNAVKEANLKENLSPSESLLREIAFIENELQRTEEKIQLKRLEIENLISQL